MESSPLEPSTNSTVITVKPIWVNDVSGEESSGCDDIGTPDFYMISNTLYKYLGKDEIWVYKHINQRELFIICYLNTDKFRYGFKIIDDDKIKEQIEIIENIYELDTLIQIESNRMPSSHIKFEIIDVRNEIDK